MQNVNANRVNQDPAGSQGKLAVSPDRVIVLVLVISTVLRALIAVFQGAGRAPGRSST